MKKHEGMLIVLSAPSGCGKTTVAKALRQKRPELYYSVSATTRLPRKGETDGVDYSFISRERFDGMVAANEFLEYAIYTHNCYGTPREPVESNLAQGRDVLLDIDTQGARQIMKLFPSAVTVFLLPPSFEELERRLIGRGQEKQEDIRDRLAAARLEMELADIYRYRIVNDEVERAVGSFERILDQEKRERLAPQAAQ